MGLIHVIDLINTIQNSLGWKLNMPIPSRLHVFSYALLCSRCTHGSQRKKLPEDVRVNICHAHSAVNICKICLNAVMLVVKERLGLVKLRLREVPSVFVREKLIYLELPYVQLSVCNAQILLEGSTLCFCESAPCPIYNIRQLLTRDTIGQASMRTRCTAWRIWMNVMCVCLTMCVNVNGMTDS